MLQRVHSWQQTLLAAYTSPHPVTSLFCPGTAPEDKVFYRNYLGIQLNSFQQEYAGEAVQG
jgi:hypothetical protein